MESLRINGSKRRDVGRGTEVAFCFGNQQFQIRPGQWEYEPVVTIWEPFGDDIKNGVFIAIDDVPKLIEWLQGVEAAVAE